MSRVLSILIAGSLIHLVTEPAVAQTAAPPATQVTAIAEEPFGYPYAELFPDIFPTVGFTMRKDVFIEYLAERKMTYRTNNAEDVIFVDTPGTPFTSVIVSFNSNVGRVLTEFEVRFADEAQAKAYAAKMYPVPAPLYEGHEPEFYASDPGSSYRAKAWQFQNKVFLVATMANTRWANQ